MAKPGPKPKVEPADALDVFARRDDRGEPLTASEVADVLGCSRRTALNKLTDLAGDGRLRSKQVGGRSRVYWVPIDGENEDAIEGRAIANSGVSPDAAPGPGEENTDAGDVPLDAPEGIDVDSALGELALDADRRDAVRAMYDYLAEHGTARKSDFTGEAYPAECSG